MRRLIITFLLWLTIPRLRTNEQHIADLERMLSDLVSARDVLAEEIAEATRRLLAAQEVRDALNKQRGTWMRNATPSVHPLPGRMPAPFVVHSRPAPSIPQPHPDHIS